MAVANVTCRRRTRTQEVGRAARLDAQLSLGRSPAQPHQEETHSPVPDRGPLPAAGTPAPCVGRRCVLRPQRGFRRSHSESWSGGSGVPRPMLTSSMSNVRVLFGCTRAGPGASVSGSASRSAGCVAGRPATPHRDGPHATAAVPQRGRNGHLGALAQAHLRHRLIPPCSRDARVVRYALLGRSWWMSARSCAVDPIPRNWLGRAAAPARWAVGGPRRRRQRSDAPGMTWPKPRLNTNGTPRSREESNWEPSCSVPAVAEAARGKRRSAP